MRPRASITMMPSTADSRTDRRRASLSFSACSSFLRSVISRAIADAPKMVPAASRIGEMLNATSTRRPSFVALTVSKFRTRSPARIRSRIAESSPTNGGGTIT